jgi:ribosome-associated protein
LARRTVDARPTVDLCVEALRGLKGEDILIMDLRGLTDVADYFVLCTGNSDTHVKALADAVAERLEREGGGIWGSEGYETRNWVLVDAVDVVIHLFQRPAREFYRLEKLWGDARLEAIPDQEAGAFPPGRLSRAMEVT